MDKGKKGTQKGLRVNDLIFKELIKRGYSLEGNTRVWNIADSKLWYLTPNQAQSFLDLEDEPEYRKDVTEKETNLIRGNIQEIVESIGSNPINIIDLGCGDGRKAILFIENLIGKAKMRYCPIDISNYMVEKAISRVSKIRGVDEVIKFQWNISDFENIENISALLRQGEYKKNVILLLGNTLGNFEINELLYEIRSSMKEGDLLIIGNGLDNRKPEEILRSYDIKAFDKFSILPVTQLGFPEDSVQFGVRFKNSRIESYYTIKKPKQIAFLGKTVNFDVGDQIVVIISYKYNKEDFISFLKMYFDESKVYVSKDASYALVLCKK
ncbi:MAG: L-histidine N(alpha)-methyltransferase [Candidatus Pacearchaeota archaeon]|nr:L-histidine N(alpha)-methyltransferase [Candidatus Pacearchaeota archaeon]